MEQLHYWLGKALWYLLAPSHFLLVLLVIGIVLIQLKRPIGKAITTVATLTLLLFVLTPIEYFLLSPLEQRVKAPDNIDHIDSIIVLGGGQDQILNHQYRYSGFGQHSGRIIAAVDLAKRYQVPLIFVGGSKMKQRQHFPESKTLVTIAKLAQLPLDQLIINDDSNDTFDNALQAKRIINQYQFKHSLLITSAAHMPRAVGVFNAQGISTTPYPVEYFMVQDPDWLSQGSLVRKLYLIEYATHEWLGLLKYYALGMSETLFP